MESLHEGPNPERLQEFHDHVHDIALRTSTIELRPLLDRSPESPVYHMAADGVQDKNSVVCSIATLCSESPEVILRVMRDTGKGSDYIQVAAEEPGLAAHVMVQVPELGKEFITDADGRAAIDLGEVENIEELKWQIKMPEVVFALEPLRYDPEMVEYSEDVTLETDRHDRIEVHFEGKTMGKLLTFRVVALDGKSSFGPIRVSITQGDRSHLQSVESGKPVEFSLIDGNTPINIRLYQ